MTQEPISPEAYLEVAQKNQEKYEAFMRRDGGMASSMAERHHFGGMAENNALLAIAGFLAQQHLCGHGTRGWCPHCHTLLKEGQPPA